MSTILPEKVASMGLYAHTFVFKKQQFVCMCSPAEYTTNLHKNMCCCMYMNNLAYMKSGRQQLHVAHHSCCMSSILALAMPYLILIVNMHESFACESSDGPAMLDALNGDCYLRTASSVDHNKPCHITCSTLLVCMQWESCA